MKIMNDDYTMKVPMDIREMAMKIEDWFVDNHISSWTLMNICSRNHVNTIQNYRREIDAISNQLKRLI
jgi:hypothetical protein